MPRGQDPQRFSDPRYLDLAEEVDGGVRNRSAKRNKGKKEKKKKKNNRRYDLDGNRTGDLRTQVFYVRTRKPRTDSKQYPLLRPIAPAWFRRKKLVSVDFSPYFETVAIRYHCATRTSKLS